MKSTLEEFGLAIVAIIIIGVYMVFAKPYGNLVTTYITTSTEKFYKDANSQIDSTSSETVGDGETTGTTN